MKTTLEDLLFWLRDVGAVAVWAEPHPKATHVHYLWWSPLWERNTLGIVAILPAESLESAVAAE